MANQRQPSRHNLDDVNLISPHRWWELYWAPTSGYPSVNALAKQFGCHERTIKRRLLTAGLELRFLSEQTKRDYAAGRRRHPVNPNPTNLKNAKPWQGKRLPRAMRAKIGKANRKEPVRLRCGWCAAPFALGPSDYTKRQRQAGEHWRPCHNRSCANSFREWREHHPGLPRPLILARLQELLKGEPLTLETAERQALLCGAEEAEIMAVLGLD